MYYLATKDYMNIRYALNCGTILNFYDFFAGIFNLFQRQGTPVFIKIFESVQFFLNHSVPTE